MTLIVQCGARQYTVSPNQKIIVNRIEGEVGDIISLPLIQAFGEGKDINEVFGKIVGHQRGEKVIVAKYKPKSNYRRRYGPRQEETILEITLSSQAKENKSSKGSTDQKEKAVSTPKKAIKTKKVTKA